MGSDAEARARVRVNRNRGCAEDGQHAQRGPARSSVRGRPQLQALHPLAQGRPLGPRGEASQLASPRGCRTEAAAALWRLAKVAHSLCCLRPSRTRQCWRLAAAPSSAAACEATSSGEPTWLSSYPPRVRGGSTARAVWSSASCERACRFPLRTMDVSQSAIFIGSILRDRARDHTRFWPDLRLRRAHPKSGCSMRRMRRPCRSALKLLAKSLEIVQNRSKSALKIHFSRVRVLFPTSSEIRAFFTRFTEVKVRPSFHILVHT
jgi:hypothetical protein